MAPVGLLPLAAGGPGRLGRGRHLGPSGLGSPGQAAGLGDLIGETRPAEPGLGQLVGPVGLDLLEGVAEGLPAHRAVGRTVEGRRTGRRLLGPIEVGGSRLGQGLQAGQPLAGGHRLRPRRLELGVVDDCRLGRHHHPRHLGGRTRRGGQRLQQPLVGLQAEGGLLQPGELVGGGPEGVELGLGFGHRLRHGVELLPGVATFDDQGVVLLPAPVEGRHVRGRGLEALLGDGGRLLGGVGLHRDRGGTRLRVRGLDPQDVDIGQHPPGLVMAGRGEAGVPAGGVACPVEGGDPEQPQDQAQSVGGGAVGEGGQLPLLCEDRSPKRPVVHAEHRLDVPGRVADPLRHDQPVATGF